MLCLLAVMVLLAVRSLTLEGGMEGLAFYLMPNFHNLMYDAQGNFILWEAIYAAMGQAFFTLSLGIGALAIFGSYIGKEHTLPGEALRVGFNLWSGFQPLGAGTSIMDLEDFLVSDNILPLGSLVYLLFCVTRKGWGWDNFLAEANTGSGLRFPRNVRFYVTFLLPIIMFIIFVMGYWNRFFA